ncbi:MAG TPA: hypothetical protein VFS33_04135 [Gemmatimonadales bacterium]|nr:hypothetical protein [Gemmatimonadales bacterium]
MSLTQGRAVSHPVPARVLPWVAVLLLGFVLASWGNRWGAPSIWHPDEITQSALDMARERTANPHAFFYGALPRMAVIGGIIVPVRVYARVFDPRPAGSPEQLAAWQDRQTARVVQGARFLSALYHVGLVAIVGAVGWLLFGEAVGLLAALFLSMAGLAIVFAHFATVDAGATMWYWAACLCALIYWLRRGGAGAFYAACFLAGIATGVKVDRGIVVLVLVTSWLLRADRSWRVLLLGLGLAAPAGYVLANPALVTSPFEYLDGFTRDLFYNALRGAEAGGYAFIGVTGLHGLGVPLAVLAGLTAAYGVVELWRQRRRDALIWLLSTVLPYFVVIGRGRVYEWYIPFFFPPLLLLAGYGCVELARRLGRVPRLVLATVIAGIAVATLARTVGLLRYFTEDPRVAAESWIAAHVPAGDTVTTIGTKLRFPYGRYTVRTLPNLAGCANHLTGRERLLASSTYQGVQAGIRRVEDWSAAHLGTTARAEPYRAWFDHLAVACAEHAPVAIHANYVAVLGEAASGALKTHWGLDSGYAPAAQIGPLVLGDYRPTEFVGAPVTIYRRMGSDR